MLPTLLNSVSMILENAYWQNSKCSQNKITKLILFINFCKQVFSDIIMLPTLLNPVPMILKNAYWQNSKCSQNKITKLIYLLTFAKLVFNNLFINLCKEIFCDIIVLPTLLNPVSMTLKNAYRQNSIFRQQEQNHKTISFFTNKYSMNLFINV